MKRRLTGLLTLALVPALWAAAPVKWAGARSSIYGMGANFPTAPGWISAFKQLSKPFPDAKPTAIWIVGALHDKGCQLEFPAPKDLKNPSEHITFMDVDRHEAILTAFDAEGVQVFLQVESGLAKVDQLLDLVLRRYKHHPCVAGFGIDVEWYDDYRTDAGKPVKDPDIQRWEQAVKSHNKNYRLFLKHYDKKWLGDKYRGDIIYVDDSQQFKTVEEFLTEMKEFADHFYPNPVMYQIGYPADRTWWKPMANPPQELGKRLAEVVRQPCGIVWVDFTLRDVVKLEGVPAPK